MPNTCSEITRLLQDYADGVLDKSTAQSVRKHIDSCPDCALEYKYLKTLINDISGTRLAAPPPSFAKELHEKIQKETANKKVVSFNYRYFTRIAATAAVIALAVFYTWYSKNTINDTANDLMPKTKQSSDAGVQKIPENKADAEQPENAAAEQKNTAKNDAAVLPADNVHIYQKPVVDAPETDTEPQHETVKETEKETLNETAKETEPPAETEVSKAVQPEITQPESTADTDTSTNPGDIMTIAMSADIEADTAPRVRSGGGAAAFKADASFCRYKADLNGNNELLAELTEKYGAVFENGEYVIRADSLTLGDISSFLADYGIYLEFEGNTENINIIELK